MLSSLLLHCSRLLGKGQDDLFEVKSFRNPERLKSSSWSCYLRTVVQSLVAFAKDAFLLIVVCYAMWRVGVEGRSIEEIPSDAQMAFAGRAVNTHGQYQNT